MSMNTCRSRLNHQVRSFLFYNFSFIGSLLLLSLHRQSTVFSRPPWTIMDIIITDYIDDIVVLDYTDLHTYLDLQAFVFYYLMYHNVSLPALTN